MGFGTKCSCMDRLEPEVSIFTGLCSAVLFKWCTCVLAAGRVEIGVNSHDDSDSSSQEGLKSWSESSHTEPLSMTVSL
jgi:hypothetical protein